MLLSVTDIQEDESNIVQIPFFL